MAEISELAVPEIVVEWGIPTDQRHAVCSKLKEIGVSTKEDLKFLKAEEDLADVLKPIQARRVASLINNMFATNMPSTSQHTPTTLQRQYSISSESSDSSTPFSPSPSPSPSQNWVSSFKIPYDKFPQELLDACEKGERPRATLRLEMVRLICAKIKEYNRLPGKRNVEIIADRLVSKYPRSFLDNIESEAIGSGSASLVSQMLDRMVNAYGRGKGIKRLQPDDIVDTDMEQARGKRKHSDRDSYGCINFNPVNLPDNETEESLQLTKNYLCEESLKLRDDRDQQKEQTLMHTTYVIQRRYINQKPIPTIGELKKEWPLLFEMSCMFDHFKELTGIDLKTNFRENLMKKQETFVKFISVRRQKAKGVKDMLQRFYRTTDEEEKSALVLLLVLLCFGENVELLVKEYEETTNGNEVEMKTTEVTPHIAKIGGDLPKYFLLVEKKIVNENVQGLLDGIMMVFATHYILNLQYNDGLSSMMEFIQRFIVNLNPVRGSRSRLNKNTVGKKVLSFINAVKDFDWEVE